MKRILLGKTMNTRDLGGFPCPSGYTRHLRLLRSDRPKGLGKRDISFLISNNITTVIDLRNDMEVENTPNELDKTKGFRYVRCPMFADGRIPQTQPDMVPAYLKLATTPDIISPVLLTIAQAKGGVLFHCTAGKDRTGVVAAVMLMLAGVPKADIMADYTATNAYLLENYRSIMRNNPEFPFFLTKADISYIEGFLCAFDKKYPDMQSYIKDMGLSEKEGRAAAGKLTDK